MYPTAAVSSENDPRDDEPPRKPGSLPDGADLDTESRDLLLRLLEIEPSRRLRSLRTLQTIAFYKGYDFDAVRQKKVKPNDILRVFFPDGPPGKIESEEATNFEAFESQSVLI